MKTLFAIVCCMAALAGIGQPVQQHGALRVAGTQLVNQNGQPVVLRGMSFGWHNWWPRFYNAGAVHQLATQWKCSVVRAAMGVEPDNGYIQNPEESKRLVRNVVDAAIKEGIYVIIDWHSHNINLPEAKAFFKEMATLYGKYPNIIYEIFNEPDKETWEEVKEYSGEVINTIRAIDKHNIILVGSPHWDQDIHLVANNPLTGFDNIMYTVHFYAATHKQWLRDRCNNALAKGIPLFISESAGMEASGDGTLDMAEWKSWTEWAENNKISWVVWSVSDKNETCSVLLPNAASAGPWPNEVLNASGRESKSLLQAYASGGVPSAPKKNF